MPDRGDPLGFDTYVGPVDGGGLDMTPDAATCSGAVLVRNGMLARCLADTISMTGAPGGFIAFGRDVRAWVGSPMTDSQATSRAQELSMVFARDPRLDPGSIVVEIATTKTGSAYAFTITANARTTTDFPITLFLGVSAMTVEIIASQGSA